MVPVGTLILDANTIWQLEDPVVREKVKGSLRSADLEFHPTAINLLEVVRTGNPARRLRLINTLASLAAGFPVRPLPSEALKAAGEMVGAGRDAFTWPESKMEWMLYEPERITSVHVQAAGSMLDEQQADFDQQHRTARRHVRRYLKDKGVKDPWGSVPAFLDSQWTTTSQLDSFIEAAWETLELPGKPDVEKMLKNELWRLYFEGFGATVYERAVQSQSLPPVHVSDIRQLVYLAGTFRRVLVTDDGGLIRVANAVLRQRYEGTRVLTFSQFLDLAS